MEVSMELITCPNCGMPFSMPQDKVGNLRACHNKFYCPNGHLLSFKGKSEAEQLRETLKFRDATITSLQEAEENRLVKRRARDLKRRKPKAVRKKS